MLISIADKPNILSVFNFLRVISLILYQSLLNKGYVQQTSSYQQKPDCLSNEKNSTKIQLPAYIQLTLFEISNSNSAKADTINNSSVI